MMRVSIGSISDCRAARFAAPHHSKQLHLHVARQITDLVEEDRRAVGQLESTDLGGRGVGKGTLFTAEQLALDERRGHRGTVHPNHGARRAAHSAGESRSQRVPSRSRFRRAAARSNRSPPPGAPVRERDESRHSCRRWRRHRPRDRNVVGPHGPRSSWSPLLLERHPDSLSDISIPSREPSRSLIAIGHCLRKRNYWSRTSPATREDGRDGMKRNEASRLPFTLRTNVKHSARRSSDSVNRHWNSRGKPREDVACHNFVKIRGDLIVRTSAFGQ